MDSRFSLRLRFATLPAEDLGKARAFYHGVLRLPVTGEKPDEFIQVGAGGVDLCIDKVGDEDGPRLVFAVDDLDSLCRELKSADVTIDGPKGSHGRRYILVRDPAGNLLAFEEG